MAAGREMARVIREIEALQRAVDADLRRGDGAATERRALRSDIEGCMQTLDEMRNKLIAQR